MASNKLLPGWFPEQTTVSQKRENVVKDLIGKIFERYWFVNIETPAIESVDVLTAKWWDEVSSQIFWLYGLAQWAEDLKKYALHFDLTVPLARYIIDHENEIKFPFKRFQIQKVRRGERQQKWRFKEFYQCDVDVIDDQLNIYYDAEVIEVLYTTILRIFKQLELQKDLVVKVNNRAIYDKLFESHAISQEERPKVLAVIDSYYKYNSVIEFENNMNEILGSRSVKLLEELKILTEFFQWTWWSTIPQWYNTIWEDVQYVMQILKNNGVNVEFDPYIVRWLDYYDGTVFETYVSWHEGIGSVCSGWRYSNLVWSVREKTHKKGKNYWWVWWSIGLSRLLYVMEQEWLLTKDFSLSDVLIFNTDKEWYSSETTRHEIARILRDAGVRVDHYIDEDKLWKQFNYAESKKIPFGIFVDNNYSSDGKIKIKDLRNREDTHVILHDLQQTLIDLLSENSNNDY